MVNFGSYFINSEISSKLILATNDRNLPKLFLYRTHNFFRSSKLLFWRPSLLLVFFCVDIACAPYYRLILNTLDVIIRHYCTTTCVILSILTVCNAWYVLDPVGLLSHSCKFRKILYLYTGSRHPICLYILRESFSGTHPSYKFYKNKNVILLRLFTIIHFFSFENFIRSLSLRISRVCV